MTTDTVNPDAAARPDTLDTERGLLFAVLVMVLLGVAGMFLISA
ncbi:hypothetical protein [Polymorphospora rubra]|uniref:Uncharacterized protein n=1 Tax=Polymorphospora rubra TaxID=338584 RepID=A0A810N291_9ACTN|nr:hypothetical protein [Polymorphospora rubra]BCJ67761.1 hypothetical protein Prubr_47820 [Polymorphospora rubra]